MSVEAMAWALRVPIGGNSKLVLIGLANHARVEFDEARPSVGTLATYANCDERTVRRHLRQLEADGWIEKTGEYALGGRRDRCVYVYRLRGDKMSASDRDGGTLEAERGDKTSRNGGTPMSPEPSLETVLEPSESARARERPDQTSLDVPEEKVEAFLRWHGDQLRARRLPLPSMRATARAAARELLRLAPGDDLRAMFEFAMGRTFWASKVVTMPKWRQHYSALRVEWLAQANRYSRNETEWRGPASRREYDTEGTS